MLLFMSDSGLSKVCSLSASFAEVWVFVRKPFYLPLESHADKLKAFMMAVKLPSVPVTQTHTMAEAQKKPFSLWTDQIHS